MKEDDLKTKAIQKYLLEYYNDPLHPKEIYPRFRYDFMEIPLESMYLKEFIDELLTIYNTVSIQKTKDSYYLKLEKKA